MSEILSIQLQRPVSSARIHDNYSADLVLIKAAAQKQLQQRNKELQEQIESLKSVRDVFNNFIDQINDLQENILKQHSEQIVRLSIEIASRLLSQKIESDDYEISPIIKDILDKSPIRSDVVLHINPDDYVKYEKLKEQGQLGSLCDVKVVEDSNVSKAHCVLETSRGVIESQIEEGLERISKALIRTE